MGMVGQCAICFGGRVVPKLVGYGFLESDFIFGSVYRQGFSTMNLMFCVILLFERGKGGLVFFS